MGTPLDRLMATQSVPQTQSDSLSRLMGNSAGGGDNSSPAVSIPTPSDTNSIVAQPQQTATATAASQEQQPGALKEFALSAIGGALAPFSGLVNHAAKYFPSLSGLANQFNLAAQDIATKSYDPTNSTENKVARVAGGLVGGFAGTGPLFEGALGATKAAGSVFETVTPTLAARVVSKIARAAEWTEGVVKQVAGPVAGNLAGQAVLALPKNAVAGLGMQAAIDPDGTKTPIGLATGIGFAGLSSVLEGASNLGKVVNPRVQYSNPNLSAEENQLLGGMHVTTNVDVPDVRAALDKFYTDFVDRFHGFKAFERNVGNLPNGAGAKALATPGPLPSELAALSNGSSGVADAMLHNQVFVPDYATGNMIPNPNVDPLSKVLADYAPDKDSQDQLRALLAARRITDPRIQTGAANGGPLELPQGWDLATARKVIANAKPNISAAADGVLNYLRNGVRAFGEAAGTINPVAAQVFDVESPNYIPLFRDVMQQVDPALKPIDNTFGPGKVIQRMFGSTKDVLDPFQNIKDLTHIVTKASARNAIGQKLLTIASNLTDSEQEALGIKILGPADKYSNPAMYDMADKIYNLGLSYGHDFTMQQALDFASLYGKQYDPVGNILTIQNGAKGLTRMQLSPELAQSYKYMNMQQTPFVVRLLGLPAKALTAGTTMAMDFSLANSLRDNFDAVLQSKYGFKLGVDSWKGFLESIGQGKYGGSMRDEWLAAGGGEGTANRAGMNINTPFNNVIPQSLPEKALTVFAHPIQAMYQVTRPFYEAAPLGEYMLGREQGASAMEAALASRNVVTDWARRGGHPVMQALSQMTSFLNPSVQYLDRNVRNFATNTGGAVVKGIVGITMPSALLWASSHGSLWGSSDDDEINNLRRTEDGLTNWYFRLPNGNIGKLPKPFLYGQVFGTTIETALDKMYNDDPHAVKRLVTGLVDQSTLNMVPNSVMLPFQMEANYDMNSSNSIIPDRLAKLDPQAQVLPGTSDLARYVSQRLYTMSGGKINVSPIHLDWLGKQTLGSTGRNIEVASGQQVGSVLADKPFIHRFLASYPSMDVEPVQTFYDEAAKTNKVAQTIDYYGKTGNVDALNNYISRHASQLAVSSIYAETQKQLSDIESTMHQIDALPQLSKDQKRSMNNYLMRQIILITSTVNKTVPEANDPDEILK